MVRNTGLSISSVIVAALLALSIVDVTTTTIQQFTSIDVVKSAYDVNKHGKFVVLRTYFTKSDTLEWMNGLVCILSGKVETSPRVFKSTGYELTL